MSRYKLSKGLLAIFASLFVHQSAFAEYGLNMTQGVTPISKEIYDLHMIIFYICCVIGVIVFGAIFYSLIKFRKSKGAVPAKFHHSTMVEIVWTLIPFAILVLMAIPATKTLIEMENTSDFDMTVKVTGSQWKWEYSYLADDLSEQFNFISSLATPSEQYRSELEGKSAAEKNEEYLLEVDEEVVLPIKKKIRILTTAADVIHAWWVPALGWKRDAIPGFVNESWTYIEEPGVYRGMCAELCGKDHGFMPIVVRAVEQDEYEAWAEGKRAEYAESQSMQDLSNDELMAEGKKNYDTLCATCHGASFEGGLGPALGKGSMATGSLADHIDVVLNGVPGTAMSAFGGQLSARQIATIITYERNAFGNDTGDYVQPKDIQNAMNAQ